MLEPANLSYGTARKIVLLAVCSGRGVIPRRRGKV